MGCWCARCAPPAASGSRASVPTVPPSRSCPCASSRWSRAPVATEREFSAGGVVVRNMHGRPFMAAVRVKRGAVLALPKGHIDPGESAVEAAARAVREETGVEGTLIEKLDDIRYWYARAGTRVLTVVSFFLFRY